MEQLTFMLKIFLRIYFANFYDPLKILAFETPGVMNLMTCASKLIKTCSVKLYVIRTMCCTALFLSLPPRTVILSDLEYMIECTVRSSVALNRLQFYHSHVILSSLLTRIVDLYVCDYMCMFISHFCSDSIIKPFKRICCVLLLHFAWVVDDAKCIVVTRICVSVCLCVCPRPHGCLHYCTDPDVT